MCDVCGSLSYCPFAEGDGDNGSDSDDRGGMDANPLAAVGSAVGPLTPAELATRMLTLVDSRASWDLVQNTSTAAPRTLTYRFETTAPPDNPWTDVSGFVAYTEEHKAAVRDVLAEYARVLNVVFVEMTGAGDPNISLCAPPTSTIPTAATGRAAVVGGRR